MKLFSLLLSFSLAIPFSGVAQTDVSKLDPVVVTSVRSKDPLVISTDAKTPVQPVPAYDGADVLKNIPGFSVIRKGGTDGDLVLRGMAGSRLSILVEGETVLGGCFMRMDPPTAYIFPAAYDRITVIKGPQSVRYGPISSAGLVRFERDFVRREDTGATMFSTVTVGSFDRLDGALDLRGGNNFLQGRIAATYSEMIRPFIPRINAGAQMPRSRGLPPTTASLKYPAR
jgi:iron complex outermembrane receptor protein